MKAFESLDDVTINISGCDKGQLTIYEFPVLEQILLLIFNFFMMPTFITSHYWPCENCV